jgi:hypothetical protein
MICKGFLAVDCTDDIDRKAFLHEEEDEDVLLANLDAQLGPGGVGESKKYGKFDEFFGPDNKFREKFLAGGDNHKRRWIPGR